LESLVGTVTSNSDEAEGWAKRMHFFLNLTLAWAAIRVYMATAGLKWDTFMARRLARNHIIVIAGGESENQDSNRSKGKRNIENMPVDKAALAVDIALSLAGSGAVVLSLPGVDEGSRTRLWRGGVTLLTVDMGMPDVLEASGGKRARMLIAMRDHFGDNITLTRAALSASFANQSLKCKCMIEPLSVKNDFVLEDYFEPQMLPRIRIFNESEMVARRLVRAYPPDDCVASSDLGVHLLLVGLDSVGQSILVQMARIGHYRSGKKPKITVVDRNVKQLWKQVLESFPAIEQWVQVETQETRFEDIGLDELDKWINDERKITMVYVCASDEIANLRIARLLLRSLTAHEKEIDGSPGAKVVALDPAGGCVLSEFATQGEYQGRFHLYSLVTDVQAKDQNQVAGGLLSDFDDARAKQFHEAYCAMDDQKCNSVSGSIPADFNKSWETVPETIRNANRKTADHFEVKLRAVGCQIVGKSDCDPVRLNPDEVEILAKMEHDRWWADRSLDGWRCGSQRDNKLKIHPDMVPYEQLLDEKKQLDRDSVIQMIHFLEQDGQILTRV